MRIRKILRRPYESSIDVTLVAKDLVSQVVNEVLGKTI